MTQCGRVVWYMTGLAPVQTGQTCSHERVSGRHPKVHSPIPGLAGALCQWQWCHPPCSKSVDLKKKKIFNYHFIVEKQYNDASVIMRISAAHKYLSVLLIPLPHITGYLFLTTHECVRSIYFPFISVTFKNPIVQLVTTLCGAKTISLRSGDHMNI